MEEVLYELMMTPEERRAEQEEREELRRARAEQEAERVRREAAWKRRHPTEWEEWVRLQPLLNPLADVWADRPFDFDEFLKEVGRRPSPDHQVVRPDATVSYQQGNLVWAEPVAPKVPSPYLTVDEAAVYCRRAAKTILNHLSLGNIRAMPATRPPLFRREDLDDWLSVRRKSPRR